MKVLGTIALFLGGLLLLLYPFVLLADVMGLAGFKSGAPLTLEVVTIYIFYLGTLAYPVIYLPSLIITMVMRAKDKELAGLVFSILPLIYLLIIFGIPAIYSWITGGARH